MTLGTFIAPDEALHDLPDPAAALGIEILSGYQACHDMHPQLGQNRIFDRIAGTVGALSLACEDQCSPQYYYDIVRTLRDYHGQFDRVVEVGVFMGGSTAYLAGCIEAFDFDLDLVDISAEYLRFAHERVRRMFPDAARRIRLFHGDVPAYVRHVMLEERGRRNIVHHDGDHNFEQVVKDLSALSFVREDLVALIAQDTHLRGTPRFMNFVDMALYAVFGTELNYAPIGAAYHGENEMTQPNRYQGNYFMPGVAEGVVLPMAANRFLYPHPLLGAEHFLPPPRATLDAAA
ncbi:CmcI family methyltransferase [Sphingomonas sp. NPDC092331]|jgi:Methyltransferase domain|uniref:CmcI family methyltransferase n=1 Tax=unclassified Sphingomonas TaxID=196159 RepID=UPI0031F5C8A0